MDNPIETITSPTTWNTIMTCIPIWFKRSIPIYFCLIEWYRNKIHLIGIFNRTALHFYNYLPRRKFGNLSMRSRHKFEVVNIRIFTYHVIFPPAQFRAICMSNDFASFPFTKCAFPIWKIDQCFHQRLFAKIFQSY